jgi:transcription-repair coupling factor (superfamily II helicase)
MKNDYLCRPKMNTESLLNLFAGQDACRQLHSLLAGKDGATVSIKGLNGSARSLAVAAALEALQRTQIYVAAGREAAEYVCHDVALWCRPEQVFFLPSSYQRSIEYGQPDASHIVQRTAAMKALSDEAPCVAVTYPEALAELVGTHKAMARQTLPLRVGETLSIEFLRGVLMEYGFERVDFVTEPGQFAVRGSLVDIFSFADHRPYRIDFCNDEVESLRSFNINSQLSDQKWQQIDIISNLNNLPKKSLRIPLFDFAGGTGGFTLWIEDYACLLGIVEALWEKEALRHKLLSPEQLRQTVALPAEGGSNDPLMAVNPGTRVPEGTGTGEPAKITFTTVPQPTFNKNFELLAADLTRHAAEGYRIYICTENGAQMERLKAIFHSIGKKGVPLECLPIAPHEGFVDHSLKIGCYTDHQLFDRYHRVTQWRAVEKSDRMTWQELSALQQGDYVVHIDHGVGIFGGLVKMPVGGKLQEFVKLIYLDNDVLMVNIHGLHRIAKYKSRDSEAPKINKLGSGAWQQLKQRAKHKVKDIARELTLLYAQRKRTPGFAFSGDTYLQHELEASFLYEDTPDQLKATQAVKADMEQSYPMDRLICGDVGFGKTEIAIRAAFKAAVDGKQVAVLVPTTILALQHFNTFSARLAQFPVKVDYLSRLRPAKQLAETRQAVAEGKVDIVIGTHQLLQKQITFKDLGLLIVDEEQKFGVTAKERLRQMKQHVDTLTMSATPIPRTLQFSLMGARDLSIITTPPANRHPIVTELHTFQDAIVRDAVRNEIQRGGQVFFVHNRIRDIQEIADRIRRICPEVHLCIGHGQMPPQELEKVMLEFMAGRYDLLLCTTIVENGLDIPNANTIIINGAHRFGLSDLHQLRGRVGRSNRKAYCYLLTPPMGSLPDDARRRLRAIATFSELGSGFNIAMQDLDIRGAGNLLGGEQSGFIADIGFESYQKILNEALTELQSEEGTAEEVESAKQKRRSSRALETNIGSGRLTDCSIDTDMEILIPSEYVSNAAERLRIYKELDQITDDEQLKTMVAELTDRFGALPPEVEQLCQIVRLRQIAMRLGFEKVVLKNNLMVLYFISNAQSNYYRSPLFSNIIQCVQTVSHRLSVKEHNGKLMMIARCIDSVRLAAEVLEQIGTVC